MGKVTHREIGFIITELKALISKDMIRTQGDIQRLNERIGSLEGARRHTEIIKERKLPAAEAKITAFYEWQCPVCHGCQKTQGKFPGGERRTWCAHCKAECRINPKASE